MRCISIWQPWASLLFSPGEYRKEYETRPLIKRGAKWYPSINLNIGERVAIHASKTRKGIEIVEEESSQHDRLLILDSILHQFKGVEGWHELPFGCIIGVVEIGLTSETEHLRPIVSVRERAFGDFGQKRVGIQTLDPIKLETPVPYRGQQGVFAVDFRKVVPS